MLGHSSDGHVRFNIDRHWVGNHVLHRRAGLVRPHQFLQGLLGYVAFDRQVHSDVVVAASGFLVRAQEPKQVKGAFKSRLRLRDFVGC